MTTYAIADQVPPECDHITAGKGYEVLREFVSQKAFIFKDDNSSLAMATWENSAHVFGGNWRRVDK